ncbi:MAG: 4-(cytidine 5'-diphospho)-2-C-methyl-D-erythritol kinase [Chitinophagaceae bacterium]
MIVFPHCKINLGLQVLQKRPDGYHDIATVFYPVPFEDVLEIVPHSNAAEPVIFNYGLPVKGNTADNLCVKAWQLLKKDFSGLPPVEIHLLKNIPMGAGLGGGSADGAFMLQLLSNKFHLNLSQQQLLQYALQLGSDCPFFIINQPCYATRRGEMMEPLALDLKGYQLVIVNPGIHINTGWAFEQLHKHNAFVKTSDVKAIVMQPVTAWKQQLVNDFEQPVFAAYPQLKAIKENLYQLKAVYAAMSGSGSVVFGLFNENVNLTSGLPAHYTVIRL